MASDFRLGLLQQQVEALTAALRECVNISKIQQSQIFDLQIEVCSHQIFFYQVIYPELQRVSAGARHPRESRIRKTLAELETTPGFQMSGAKEYREKVKEKIRLLARLDLAGDVNPFSVINGGKSDTAIQ